MSDSKKDLLTNEIKLVFIVYEDGKMFPEPMITAEDNVTLLPTEIKSCILVTKLVGVEMEIIPEPLILTLRQPENYDHYLTMRPSPSWWNPLSGLWDINPNTSCQLARITGGMLEYTCNRFGYFALTMSPTLVHNIFPPTNMYDNIVHYFKPLIGKYLNLYNVMFQYCSKKNKVVCPYINLYWDFCWKYVSFIFGHSLCVTQ